jgi:hypothetical protein
MQRMQRLSIMALLGLFVAGCGGIAVKQDYDPAINFGALKSFSWQTAVQAPTGNELTDNTLLDSRFRAAIERELQAKGHAKVATGPDYLVAYSYTVQNKIERDPYRSTVGVGVGVGSRRGGFGGIGFDLGYGDRDYEQDTLIIDVLDPATGKQLWRGFTRQRLVWQSDPEDTTSRINEAVAAILRKFPPQSG